MTTTINTLSIKDNYDVKNMALADRLGEVITRAAGKLPGEIANGLLSMLNQETLLLMAGLFVVWAASHLWGVSFFFDIAFIGVAIYSAGRGAWEGCKHVYHFVDKTLNANSETDLDQASDHLSSAITILGITLVTSILLRASSLKAVRQLKANNWKPPIIRKPIVGASPLKGEKPKITNSDSMPIGKGKTDPYGNIVLGTAPGFINEQVGGIIIQRTATMADFEVAYYHELVHRFFSPRINVMRKFRAQMGQSAYNNSAIIRGVEEAIAEMYAQCRVRGISQKNIIRGFRFPIEDGAVTVSQLKGEGVVIGTIVVQGFHFFVTISK